MSSIFVSSTGNKPHFAWFNDTGATVSSGTLQPPNTVNAALDLVDWAYGMYSGGLIAVCSHFRGSLNKTTVSFHRILKNSGSYTTFQQWTNINEVHLAYVGVSDDGNTVAATDGGITYYWRNTGAFGGLANVGSETMYANGQYIYMLAGDGDGGTEWLRYDLASGTPDIADMSTQVLGYWGGVTTNWWVPGGLDYTYVRRTDDDMIMRVPINGIAVSTGITYNMMGYGPVGNHILGLVDGDIMPTPLHDGAYGAYGGALQYDTSTPTAYIYGDGDLVADGVYFSTIDPPQLYISADYGTSQTIVTLSGDSWKDAPGGAYVSINVFGWSTAAPVTPEFFTSFVGCNEVP